MLAFRVTCRHMTTLEMAAMNPALTPAQVTTTWGTFSSFFSSNGITILNVILVATTIGGQTILKRLTFECPCAYPLNIYSSLLFIVGPCIAFLALGVLLNSTTWRLLHGSCFRHGDTRHRSKTAFVYAIEVIGKASIAPVAWLFVALLDGSYYQCLSAGNFCPYDKSVQCQNQTVLQLYEISSSIESISANKSICPMCICNMTMADASYLQSLSRVSAWTILLGYGLTAFLVICCIRMCDKYTLIQRRYVEAYKQIEEEKFDSVAKEHASQIAEGNARAFFTNVDWTKRDWDWVSGVPEISNPFFVRLRMIEAEKAATTLYTPLQLWSQHNGYKIQKPDVQLQGVDEDEKKSV